MYTYKILVFYLEIWYLYFLKLFLIPLRFLEMYGLYTLHEVFQNVGILYFGLRFWMSSLQTFNYWT